MDFPLYLETKEFVDDKKSIQQQIEVVIRQAYGTILHAPNKGSRVSVHVSSALSIHDAVEFSLKAIKEIDVVTINVFMEQELVDVTYVYRDSVERAKVMLGE